MELIMKCKQIRKQRQFIINAITHLSRRDKIYFNSLDKNLNKNQIIGKELKLISKND